ncbi:MAG: hypothetical protein WCN86_01555 [bacterium]
MQKIIKPQLILLSGILLTWPQGAMAACDLNTTSGGANCAGTDIQANLTGSDGILTNVINILIIAAAIASVIMIVIGGFRYIFSQGEEKNTTAAKDTILYAIIGLVVSILAFAIVNFVLKKF